MTVPFDVTDKVLEEAEECGALGMSIDQTAWALGCNPSTLYKYKAKVGALTEAISRGRARGIRNGATSLKEQIDSGNAQSTMFFLRNMATEQWNNDSANVAKIQVNLARISDSELLTELREDPALLKVVNAEQIEGN